jgi:hypothetical protein
MGKISELEMAISDLRTAATTINDVADTLAGMFSSNEAAEPTAAEAPVEEKQPLTLDEVSNTLMGISRISRAHSQKLRDLIRKYGANKLSEVAPEHYEAILAEAEVIRNGG